MVVLVKEELTSSMTVLEDLMSPLFPSVWLSVQSENQTKIIVCIFYRTWQDINSSTSVRDQQDRLNILLEQISRASKLGSHLTVFGDANLDANKFDDPSYPLHGLVDSYRSTIASQGLQQMNIGNTYCAHRTRSDGSAIVSAIDHVLTSLPDKLRNIKLVDGPSDHSGVLASIGFHRQKQTKIPIKSQKMRRNYKKMNQSGFIYELSNKNWDLVGNDIQDINLAVKQFTENIIESLDVYAPLKKIPRRRRGKGSIPLSAETKKLRKHRDALKQKVLHTPPNESKDIVLEYKRVRNKVTAKIRSEQRTHIKKQIDDDPSSGNVWKIVNEALNPGQCKNEPEISSNDLNSHFINKITQLQNKINPSQRQDPLIRLADKLKGRKLNFTFKPVKVKEVKKIILKLRSRSAPGPDEIDPAIIKLAIDVLALPLTNIINKSLTSGVFPDSWKVARISPIYKLKGKNIGCY